MEKNTIEFLKVINSLLSQITEFKYHFLDLNECEENQKKRKSKQNQFKINEQTIEKKLKEKETKFDQINELYFINK